MILFNKILAARTIVLNDPGYNLSIKELHNTYLLILSVWFLMTLFGWYGVAILTVLSMPLYLFNRWYKYTRLLIHIVKQQVWYSRWDNVTLRSKHHNVRCLVENHGLPHPLFDEFPVYPLYNMEYNPSS